MAEIGIQKKIVDVYAVEANEVVVSQITQENNGVGCMCVDVGGVVDGVEGGVVGNERGDKSIDFECSESGDRVMDCEGCESGDGDESIDSEGEGGETEVGKRNGDKTKNDKATGKGKGIEKAMAIGNGKGTEYTKGTGKVKGTDIVRSVVAEDDPAEDPSFIDSDYDLIDHEEDTIMAVQVEGWKKVVEEMVNDHIGDKSDSDQLPSESPSSGSEDEKEQDDNDDKSSSSRYKAATDLNDPKLEVGISFNCKEDFIDFIRHK